MIRKQHALIGWAIAILAACTSEPAAPDATVFFVIDAPLCSSRIPVEFSIDGVLAGNDTFLVNLAPTHTRSAGFTVHPGTHTLGARVVSGLVWPDTTVTVSSGDTVLDSLPFYCS